MPEWWKLKREIARLGKQFFSLGGLFIARLRRKKYDLTGRKKARETTGTQPLGPDLAILLIYQPEGLLTSTFWQLDQLNQRGVTPFVVCNHPLSTADRDRLIPLCHLILERQNIGYDFGGYRDGVLTVLDKGFKLDRLFILNDSVWFPLTTECTLIEDARAAPADLFGIFFNTKNRHANHHHLQSYFYRFNATILRDPRFERYWRSLPLYRSKRHVIRECEIKLSGKIKDMGFDVDALLHPEDVAAAVNRLSDNEFIEIARFYATTSLRGRSIFSDILDISPNSSEWPEARKKLASHTRLKYYFIDAHPLLLIRELHAPFLKKGREYHYYRQRSTLIDLDLHKGIDPVVAKEVVTWNARKPAPAPESPDFPAV